MGPRILHPNEAMSPLDVLYSACAGLVIVLEYAAGTNLTASAGVAAKVAGPAVHAITARGC